MVRPERPRQRRADGAGQRHGDLRYRQREPHPFGVAGCRQRDHLQLCRAERCRVHPAHRRERVGQGAHPPSVAARRHRAGQRHRQLCGRRGEQDRHRYRQRNADRPGRRHHRLCHGRNRHGADQHPRRWQHDQLQLPSGRRRQRGTESLPGRRRQRHRDHPRCAAAAGNGAGQLVGRAQECRAVGGAADHLHGKPDRRTCLPRQRCRWLGWLHRHHQLQHRRIYPACARRLRIQGVRLRAHRRGLRVAADHRVVHRHHPAGAVRRHPAGQIPVVRYQLRLADRQPGGAAAHVRPIAERERADPAGLADPQLG
ncbi:hypothetical protein D3C78_867160 [compost metagenome]